MDEGPSNPFLDVWFADDKTGVAVGSYGMIFRTLDGGATWEAWNEHISNPDGFHYYSLDSSADGTLILAGEQGLLYRSRDNGAEWERLTTPYAGSFFGVRVMFTLCLLSEPVEVSRLSPAMTIFFSVS